MISKRAFFSRLGLVVGAASLSPTIFVPKFEAVHWKVSVPQWQQREFIEGFFWRRTLFEHERGRDSNSPGWQDRVYAARWQALPDIKTVLPHPPWAVDFAMQFDQ